MSDKLSQSVYSVNFAHIGLFGLQWGWEVWKDFWSRKVLVLKFLNYPLGFTFLPYRHHCFRGGGICTMSLVSGGLDF